MEFIWNNVVWFGVAASVLFALTLVYTALMFRRVVATNEVHIVQSSKRITSYGKDTNNGNTYYEWPSWIPFIGVTKIVLPVSNFDIGTTNVLSRENPNSIPIYYENVCFCKYCGKWKSFKV